MCHTQKETHVPQTNSCVLARHKYSIAFNGVMVGCECVVQITPIVLNMPNTHSTIKLYPWHILMDNLECPDLCELLKNYFVWKDIEL